MLKKLECPNCGAPLEISDSTQVFFCASCGTKILNQEEVVRVEKHIVVEHKKEKDPHTLFIDYKSTDRSVKLVVAIRSIGRKDVIISGQKIKYILPPGKHRIVLKIGRINYNRDIVVPQDGTPVEILASWAGRANISIDQPLYDPAEIAPPQVPQPINVNQQSANNDMGAIVGGAGSNGTDRVNAQNAAKQTPVKTVKYSKPYSERSFSERVFCKEMIAPWIISGHLIFYGLIFAIAFPLGGFIILVGGVLMCPPIMELICRLLKTDKVKMIRVFLFIAAGILFLVGIVVGGNTASDTEKTQEGVEQTSVQDMIANSTEEDESSNFASANDLIEGNKTENVEEDVLVDDNYSEENNLGENNVEEKESEENKIDVFIAEVNRSDDIDLEYVEDFTPSDKSGGHYRTEFRLIAYKETIGKSYVYDGAVVDIILSSKGDIKRIYMDGASYEQCEKMIRFASPLLDKELTENDIQKTIDYIADHNEANGYYFSNLGLVMLNHNYEYEFMLKVE